MKFNNKQTIKTAVGADGFLRSTVNLGRVGSMDYLGSELGSDIADRPSAVYQVYTNADQLFHPDTIQSFEGKPVTIDHPDTMEVTSQNWKALSVGHVHNVRQEGDHLVGDIVVNDANAIKTIQDGKREVSLGYDADLDKKDGIIQKINIVGNHLAVVNEGRCGDSCKINDHKRGLNMARVGQGKAKKFADAKAKMIKLKKKFGDTNEAFATALEQAQATLASDTATEEEKAQAVSDIQAQAEQLQADAEEAIQQAQDLASQSTPVNDDDTPPPPPPSDDDKDAQISQLTEENQQLKERVAELEAQLEDQNEAEEQASVVNDAKAVFPNLKFGDKASSKDMKRKVLVATGGFTQAKAIKLADCALDSAYQAVMATARTKTIKPNKIGAKLVDNKAGTPKRTANQRMGGK